METQELLPNIGSIEEELIYSKSLVQLKIEPYRSLSCLKRINYNLERCQQSCPRYFSECRDRFINGSYVEII